jgi:hypothetical protein
MEDETPSLDRLKHRPVFLVPYAAYDGPYAGATDCLYLSLGWAQYDPRSASLKTLRHSGLKWSRQSEEIPVHRAVDLVIVLAHAIRAMRDGRYLNNINLPPCTFENQTDAVSIQPSAVSSVAEGEAFGREITSELIQRRLGKLREVLDDLEEVGMI